MEESGTSPRRSVIAVLVVVGVLVALIAAWIALGRSNIDPLTGSASAFYTIDDGKSFFKADATNIPPFDHQGSQAVQAMVYTSDGGKTQFVGYLMRFKPPAIERIKKMRADAKSGKRAVPGIDPVLQENSEVKKPGQRDWVKLSNVAAAAEVMKVRSPSDSSRLADPVDP